MPGATWGRPRCFVIGPAFPLVKIQTRRRMSALTCWGTRPQSKTASLSLGRASLCRGEGHPPPRSRGPGKGRWRGAAIHPLAARAECPWAPASGTRPAYLVLLLIHQLVALNSEPASGGGRNRGVDMGGIGTGLGQGTAERLCPLPHKDGAERAGLTLPSCPEGTGLCGARTRKAGLLTPWTTQIGSFVKTTFQQMAVKCFSQ